MRSSAKHDSAAGIVGDAVRAIAPLGSAATVFMRSASYDIAGDRVEKIAERIRELIELCGITHIVAHASVCSPQLHVTSAVNACRRALTRTSSCDIARGGVV